MYETLKRIYKKKHDVATLDEAVFRGWITVAQKAKIIAEVDG